MQDEPAPDLEGKRFFLTYPPNWDELTDEERNAACAEMAREIQRQLGIDTGD